MNMKLNKSNKIFVVAISVLLIAGYGGIKQKLEQQKREANENLHQATVALAEGMVRDANKHCDKVELAQKELQEARQEAKDSGVEIESNYEDVSRKGCLILWSSSEGYRMLCSALARVREKSYMDRDPESRYYMKDAIARADAILELGGLMPCK